MNRKLFNVFVFTAGAAVGSLVTWKVLKTKYERIVQEEIDSVKETWAHLNRREPNENAACDDEIEEEDISGIEEDVEEEDPEVVEYHKLAGIYKQSGKEAENDEEGDGDGDGEVPYINGPYVISPDEFADGNFDHDIYCLSYYEDGVLSNDWFEELDIEDTIGRDSLDHFGDYAEDIVHVRNERLKADYEVVRDNRTYAEIVANDPLLHTNAD